LPKVTNAQAELRKKKKSLRGVGKVTEKRGGKDGEDEDQRSQTSNRCSEVIELGQKKEKRGNYGDPGGLGSNFQKQTRAPGTKFHKSKEMSQVTERQSILGEKRRKFFIFKRSEKKPHVKDQTDRGDDAVDSIRGNALRGKEKGTQTIFRGRKKRQRCRRGKSGDHLTRLSQEETRKRKI